MFPREKRDKKKGETSYSVDKNGVGRCKVYWWGDQFKPVLADTVIDKEEMKTWKLTGPSSIIIEFSVPKIWWEEDDPELKNKMVKLLNKKSRSLTQACGRSVL
jgi:hypothetical protein